VLDTAPISDELSPDRACRVCGNSADNRILEAREMMLGLRDRFEYLECSGCGCLQLLDPPADWRRYYPTDYYSFSAATGEAGRFRRWLKRARARHALGQRSFIGGLLVRRWGSPGYAAWLRRAGVGWDEPILDVGSGSGRDLLEMMHAGFSNLTGVDPYVEEDIELGPGARVLAREVGEIRGPFAFAMMNHAFEHMGDPEQVLVELARLLPRGRLLLIRVPVAGKHAWREYGVDWVQLDAPRHLFIHSEQSMRLLAARTGFRIEEVRYDSTGFQFWASEQYRRNIPLNDERSFARSRARSIFSSGEVAEFEKMSGALNARGEGDQASFFLVRE